MNTTSIQQVNLTPVYWSRQHGAYITLISCWLIAVVTTGMQYMHLVSLLMLLSGLNFIELYAMRATRKSRMPEVKFNWMMIYGIVTGITALMLILSGGAFIRILPVFAAGGLMYFLLSKKKQQKSTVSELLTFVMFAIAGFSGSRKIGLDFVPLIIVMALFFGSSVFAVKERFGRIRPSGVLLYVLAASAIIILVSGLSLFGYLASLLLAIKTSGSWLYPKAYHKLHIKKIGMIEMGYQVVFIVLVALLINH